MSDGGGESAKQSESRDSEEKLGGDNFALAIAKISVAQVCEGVGFQGFQQSALCTLSDVAIRYVHQIGKTGSFYANLAGRSESNMVDVIQCLEDLGLTQGFAGASDTRCCLANSGIVREIAQYVSGVDEISFAYSIPKFPIVKNKKAALSFIQVGGAPPGDHIPAWLPKFPDPKTYLRESEVDNCMDKIELVKGQSVAERSMLNLHQPLPCNGSEEPLAVDPVDAVKSKQAAESNPFLSAPLRFGEKEVSSPVLPPELLDGSAAGDSENDVPVFQPCSPLAKPVKSSLNDSKEEREKGFPNKRTTVQFKLKSFKRSSGIPLRLKIEDNDLKNLFSEDNSDKPERKRGEKQNLKEARDYVEESAQL